MMLVLAKIDHNVEIKLSDEVTSDHPHHIQYTMMRMLAKLDHKMNAETDRELSDEVTSDHPHHIQYTMMRMLAKLDLKIKTIIHTYHTTC